jgi:hypothetical protein
MVELPLNMAKILAMDWQRLCLEKYAPLDLVDAFNYAECILGIDFVENLSTS